MDGTEIARSQRLLFAPAVASACFCCAILGKVGGGGGMAIFNEFGGFVAVGVGTTESKRVYVKVLLGSGEMSTSCYCYNMDVLRNIHNRHIVEQKIALSSQVLTTTAVKLSTYSLQEAHLALECI